MYFEFKKRGKITVEYSKLNTGDMFRTNDDKILIKLNDDMSLDMFSDYICYGFKNRQNEIMELIDYEIIIYSEE